MRKAMRVGVRLSLDALDAGNGAHRRVQSLETYDSATPQPADALLRGHPSRSQTLYTSNVGSLFQQFPFFGNLFLQSRDFAFIRRFRVDD